MSIVITSVLELDGALCIVTDSSLQKHDHSLLSSVTDEAEQTHDYPRRITAPLLTPTARGSQPIREFGSNLEGLDWPQEPQERFVMEENDAGGRGHRIPVRGGKEKGEEEEGH